MLLQGMIVFLTSKFLMFTPRHHYADELVLCRLEHQHDEYWQQTAADARCSGVVEWEGFWSDPKRIFSALRDDTLEGLLSTFSR